jgi:hypothetical protein
MLTQQPRVNVLTDFLRGVFQRRILAGTVLLTSVLLLLGQADASTALPLALLQMYETELGILSIRRQRASAMAEALSVRAAGPGRVDTVVAAGSTVNAGLVLARLWPERAHQVTAYLAPETAPADLPTNEREVIVRTGQRTCRRRLPLQPGATVSLVPGQLNTSFLGRPRWGLPLHVELPPSCHVAVGQVVAVALNGW